MSSVTCCDFNDFIKAMADENRQGILALLKQGEMSVNELVEHFSITQPTISHHLAVLRRTNLVMIRHEGKNIYYRANKSCVVECCAEILKRYNISFQWY
jgi:ArsR family transcriptional regulator, arsenate/arsenite/antimonite-responsive transcriptional repressor